MEKKNVVSFRRGGGEITIYRPRDFPRNKEWKF